jgi:transcriptional regulator with XRE-family HTH domain
VKEGALDVIKVDVFRRIRRERGLSQTALAKASGVAQTTISGIEKGAQTSSKHLPKMAAALDVEMSALDDDYATRPRLPPTAAEFVDVDFLERLAAATLIEMGYSEAQSRGLAAAWIKNAKRPRDPAPDDDKVRVMAQTLASAFS